MQQRSDIQGLRAYAVAAVMLYHFGIAGFDGGFVGVDVFFVISGFLMTAIIVRGLEAGNFSLTGFYLARARRILPALAMLCAALLAFGWWWLGPADYATLGKHTSGAIGFFSNFTFMDEEGYFDAPSKSKWLLHTWSLSVEWQFYLLYPLLLMALARSSDGNKARFGKAIAILGLLSFTASVWVTPNAAASAFYMLPTRAWEMVAGGLLYLYPPRLSERHARVAEWSGIALILGSAHLLTTLTPWPGSLAFLPVLGAMLVIAAGRRNSLLTGTPLFLAIGRWSYSIYLWHWPIVVGLGYFAFTSLTAKLAGLGGAVILGAVSYALVEQPARRFFADRKHTARAAIATMALLITAGTSIDKNAGIPARVPPHVQEMDAAAHDTLPPFTEPCGFNRKTLELKPCVLGDATNIRWVVWGDSHAGSIVSAVQAATQSGVLYYTHACSALFDTELKSKSTGNHCVEFTRKVAEQIAALPKQVGVIVINRYSVNIKGPNEGVNKPWGFIYRNAENLPADMDARYTQRLTETLCTVAKGRRLYAVKPIPELGREVPQTMVRHAMAGIDVNDVTIPLADYYARNDVALAALENAKKTCGIRTLDPVPYICDRERCHGAYNGRPLYFDDDHLNEFGNKRLLPMFRTLKP